MLISDQLFPIFLIIEMFKEWCKPSVWKVYLPEPKDEVPIDILEILLLGEGAQVNLLDGFVELINLGESFNFLSKLLGMNQFDSGDLNLTTPTCVLNRNFSMHKIELFACFPATKIIHKRFHRYINAFTFFAVDISKLNLDIHKGIRIKSAPE